MKKLIIWLALLLPFIANAQINGTIQKTASSGTIRGSFGSLGIDTIPRVTGVFVNGYILKYNASTNKWYASPDPTLVGLQDSLTKKANRTFDNVASGAIAKAKVDTSANGLLPKSNLFPLGDTRYAKGIGDAVLTTGNQTIGGIKTFTSSPVISGGNALQIESGTTRNYSFIQSPVGLGASTSLVLPSSSGTLALQGGNINQSQVVGLQDSLNNRFTGSIVSGYIPRVIGLKTLDESLIYQDPSTSSLKINTLSFPTSSSSEAAGRAVLAGSVPAFILWNTDAAAINNRSGFNIGAKPGNNSNGFGGVKLDGGLINSTDSEGFLHIRPTLADGSALTTASFRKDSTTFSKPIKINTSGNGLSLTNTTGRQFGLFSTSTNGGYSEYQSSSTIRGYIGNGSGISGEAESSFGIRSEGDLLLMDHGNNIGLKLGTSGLPTFRYLAGSGDRFVVANTSGALSTSTLSLTSGTYTPTLTNGSNVSSSTSGTGSYIRIGNQVTGYVDFIATGSSTALGDIGVSLPIASNFDSSTDVSGSLGIPRTGESTTSNGVAALNADTTNDRFAVVPSLVSGSPLTYRFHFQYIIK